MIGVEIAPHDLGGMQQHMPAGLVPPLKLSARLFSDMPTSQPLKDIWARSVILEATRWIENIFS